MNDWIAYLENSTLHIERNVDRFEHDQLLAETDDYAVVIDGLLLNQKELFDRYHTHDYLQLVLKMRQERPDDFFKTFRGPFTGLYYDKAAGRAVVFTNQTGDSAVFYYLSPVLQVFSSNYTLLVETLRQRGVTLTLDEKAAHWMLTFGYLVDEATYCQEIKRLRPGKALYLENGVWEERRYHLFHSGTRQIEENEAIENINHLFVQAVKRCFDKDLEYGYTQHLVDMSAGMDSRMVNGVAKTLGYTGITNICYSQSGGEEERLAKKASAYFGNKMIFEPLDGHEFIFDLDELVKANFGLYLYTGITGGKRLLSKLDFNLFGAEHTGQLGDNILGCSYRKEGQDAVDPEPIRLSHTLPLRYDPNPEAFENQDTYILYVRGLMGIMSSWFVRKQYTYALSPFNDVDFMEYCFSLPVSMRRDYHLYWKWVARFYPEALEVPTSRKRVPKTVFEKGSDLTRRAYRKGLKVSRKLMFKAGLVKSRVRSNASMNPYEYWYDTDPKVRDFFDNYFQEHRSLLDGHPQLAEEAKRLFESEAVLEKLMALTVMGGVGC